MKCGVVPQRGVPQQLCKSIRVQPAVYKPSCKPFVQCSAQRPEYVAGHISDPNYVRIFDTTLRDGEQSPGATMTSKEKLEIAHQLCKLGVDIIEAGFPIASPDDYEAVRSIAVEVGNQVDSAGYSPVICGLSRAKMRDVETAWEAVRLARRPRVHTFIATSQIHMDYKLKMTPDQVVENAVTVVKALRDMGCKDIEFSPEDAGRSDPVFLYRILEEVIKAGATTLNIPDTTGWNMPHEFRGLMEKLIQNTPGSDKVVWSTHCQNDLGLATANSLAGALGGARQVECTINGIGERAGNASLEEIVMAIKLRGDSELGGLQTGINTKHIATASKMVSDYSGMVVQPHKAIVGANAFAHQSGIHQDGMLKSKETYEIMSPETIGLARQDEAGIILGKLSGRNAVRNRLSQLGYDLPDDKLGDIFKRFKSIAEKKKQVMDEDLLALVGDEVHQPALVWVLEDLQVVCGTMGLPTATVKMRGPDKLVRVATAVGSGPVDAAYKAIDNLVRVQVELTDYGMNSVSEGIQALALTRVVIKPIGKLVKEASTVRTAQGQMVERTFSGTGADEDIVVSSARAYISALNKMISFVGARQQIEGMGSEDEQEQEPQKVASRSLNTV